MAGITASTFPGVYSTVTDISQVPATTSLYHPGLIGVAEKGPFDVATPIASAAAYLQTFGRSLPQRHMANYAAVLGALTDGLTVVRVGNRYTTVVNSASGGVGGNKVFVGAGKGPLFSAGDYIRISSPGLPTSVNLQISQQPVGDTLTLINEAGTPAILPCSYPGGSIVDVSPVPDAANEAEAFLQGIVYSTTPVPLGTITGNKNGYSINVTVDPTGLINAFDLVQIKQAGRVTTSEIQVYSVGPLVNGSATITFVQTNNSEYGYQSLPLQDSYLTPALAGVPAQLFKAQMATGANGQQTPVTTMALPLIAESAGTWANSDGVSSGLIVQVGPGSAPGTKKLTVYSNSAIVETMDNLTLTQSSPNYYGTVIANSNYIALAGAPTFSDGSPNVNDAVLGTPFVVTMDPANTINPWNVSAATQLNFAAFTNGFNGETPTVSDFIGTINPDDDSATGLQCFDDPNINVDTICAPDSPELFAQGSGDVGILQEICRIARARYAIGMADVPQGISARQAIDFHNGVGAYAQRGGRINNYSLMTCWNWIQITDAYYGNPVWVPPSLGMMRCQSYTFDNFAPWFAAAGVNRGQIPEALAVQFPRVSETVEAAMYGPGTGNSINAILLQQGDILVWGDRTMQVSDSKLSAVHAVVLTNVMLKTMGMIARQYVFDPNDPTLLNSLNMVYDTYLNSIEQGQGLEDYSLVCDTSNNTPATRNLKEVIIALSYIPVDCAERFYLNATCCASGTILNSLS